MMQLFKDKMRQVIAQKHLGKHMIGAIVINTVRDYFGFTDNPDLMDGYVKFDKVFLKTTQQHIKIQIFKEKKEIIEKVNQALEKVGYKTHIKEIFIK